MENFTIVNNSLSPFGWRSFELDFWNALGSFYLENGLQFLSCGLCVLLDIFVKFLEVVELDPLRYAGQYEKTESET